MLFRSPKKLFLAKSSNKSDAPPPMNIKYNEDNGKKNIFGMDEQTFHKTLVKDFQYLQRKGNLFPDNVNSAHIPTNNVALKYRDGKGRVDDCKRKDDGKQAAERDRNAFRASNGNSTVVASSRNYYCDYCFVSKQPREIFTSHQMLDLSCPSMSIQERKSVEKRKNQMKIKTIAKHTLHKEGRKLPDDKNAEEASR